MVLLLLSAIQSSLPAPIFMMDKLAPGMAVFGYSFISLFSATLISKDRSTSFMMRLLASPLTAWNFILGYMLPLLPMAVCQSIICFAAAVALGLPFSGNILLSLLMLLPAAVFFIAAGLLVGTVLNDKQVGGVCGALLTNLTAWLSGTWFDLSLIGGAFEAVANVFPFVHAVNAGRAALSGDLAAAFPDLWWVIGYDLLYADPCARAARLDAHESTFTDSADKKYAVAGRKPPLHANPSRRGRRVLPQQAAAEQGGGPKAQWRCGEGRQHSYAA